jgi:hypothetical protein
MSEIRKFTVIYYGYMRQCPSTIHSHLEHLYMPFPESRMVFSAWSRLWDSSPVPHPSFDIDASLDLLPRWVEGRLAGWNVNTPDPHSMQEVVRALHIPEVNCFGQPTWRVVSYCKSLQEAARFALSSSADEHFLFCRPDLRFEADLRPHIPDGCDCASNCGID